MEQLAVGVVVAIVATLLGALGASWLGARRLGPISERLAVLATKFEAIDVSVAGFGRVAASLDRISTQLEALGANLTAHLEAPGHMGTLERLGRVETLLERVEKDLGAIADAALRGGRGRTRDSS